MGILIFSAPINSGKTSALKQWCEARTDVAGILMPDTGKGRMMYDIQTKTFFPAQSVNNDANDTDLVQVGRYSFYRSSFEKANQLLSGLLSKKQGLIIVDEAGKLELRNEGFYPSIKLLIEHCRREPCDLLLVVREELTEEIVRYFDIDDAKVIATLQGLSPIHDR